METVGALPIPDNILPTSIIFGILSENGTEEKQCYISVLKPSRPKNYLLWKRRVVTKVLTVNVLDIGQHRP